MIGLRVSNIFLGKEKELYLTWQALWTKLDTMDIYFKKKKDKFIYKDVNVEEEKNIVQFSSFTEG